MKVTKADIEKRIAETCYMRLYPTTTTICTIRLDNGFVQVGESAAADPAKFDASLGERYAYEDALNKLFPVFAFAVLDEAHKRKTDHSFCAAIEALKAGKTVARKGHPGTQYVMRGDGMRAEFMGGHVSVMVMHTADILANDWRVIP